MIEPMVVSAGERGVIRVFTLDMPAEEARFLQENSAAVAPLLGFAPLDPAHVEVIRIADLEGLGLTGYLTEGCGIPPETLAADASRLASLSGWVLVLRSRAFGGEAGALAPDPRLSLVGAWPEHLPDWSAPAPLESPSARPYSGTRTPPRKARAEARRVGSIWFAVVMALIVGGVLWLLS